MWSGNVDMNFDPLILLSNAVAAFALNLAVYLLIGKTSALSMNIAGEMRTCSGTKRVIPDHRSPCAASWRWPTMKRLAEERVHALQVW